MAGGKRLNRGKRVSSHQHNSMSITGKLRPLPDPSESNSNIAVEDVNIPVTPPCISQNNKDKPQACPYSSCTTPEAEGTFAWWLFAIMLVISLVVGMLIYDAITPPLKPVIATVVTILTLYAFLEKPLHLPSPSFSPGLTHILGPIAFSLMISAVLLALICELGGIRLNVVSISSPNPEVGPPKVAVENSDRTTPNSPAPTAVPSPSLPSVDNNPNIADPIVVTPHPDETNMKTRHIQTDFLELIYTNEEAQNYSQFIASDIDFWRTTFIGEMKKIVATGVQQDVSDMDLETYELLTMEANELMAQIADQEQQIATLKNVIQLREDAYAIKPVLPLGKMLSDSYFSLAEEYAKISEYEAAYQNYLSATKWALIYIQRLKSIDDDFYFAIFNIATIYQRIESLAQLPDEDRIDANYISLCLFEAASQNLVAKGDTKYQSCIYAGMVSHKLLNLDVTAKPNDRVRYFEEAYNYYTKALETPSKDKKLTYGYLNQICTWAEQYSKTRQGVSLLQDTSVYEALATEFKKLSL